MMIGMAWNLFTAVFMSRVIFEFCYTKGWLKKMTMLKMMDKTNIDFIGPRYYCMAGSLILIVLGLIATGVRGQGDVQHRLHRRHPGHDPAQRERPERRRSCPSRSAPSSSAQKAERPARRDGREPQRRRRQEPGAVQHPHDRRRTPSRSSRRSSTRSARRLARVEMTVERRQADRRPPPAGRREAADAGRGRRASPGGREYELRFNTTAFNSTQSPAQVVSAVFAKVLTKAGITNPDIAVRDQGGAARRRPRPRPAAASTERR